jgi:hypothetical protein
MLPLDKVRIKGLRMNDIRLGKSIYTKKQLDEFAAYQDSQGIRRAYLAILLNLLTWDGMTRENRGWHWAPKPKLIEHIGMSFIPCIP